MQALRVTCVAARKVTPMGEGNVRSVLEALALCKGVRRMRLLSSDEKSRLLDVEADIERRIIFGMCPSLNLGVREALGRPFTAALVIKTDEFPYPHHPHMRIALGDLVVGEQVLEKDRISELRKSRENMFLWDNFVVYRSRLPREPEGRKRMKLVYMPRPFPVLGDIAELKGMVLGVPSPEGDQYLKRLIGETSTEPVLGTSLIGFSQD